MKNILFLFVCFLFSSFMLNAQQNIALDKTVKQSSNLGGGFASKAVDGNTDGNNHSFTHTKNDTGAWWQVDLGAIHDISEIKLYNRTDCCAERLTDFSIWVTPDGNWNEATKLDWKEASEFVNANTPSPTYTFNKYFKGRYVRVFLNGTGYLSLAEVEVFSFGTMPDGDNWNQPCKDCLYIRNNTTSEHNVELKSDGKLIKSLTVSPGNIQEIITRKPAPKNLYINGVWIGLDANGWPSGVKPTNIGNNSITYQNVDSNTEGYYITIGDDYFGERGPTTKNDPNNLTVSSYNVYLGTHSKPSKASRASHLMDALAAMGTDVLCLQEMNYREGRYWDAFELAAFLWNKRTDANSENDLVKYARDKVILNGGGSFPYISQFTSNIPVKPSDVNIVGGIVDEALELGTVLSGYGSKELEEAKKAIAGTLTGGGVILSKYPLETVANITFTALNPAWEEVIPGVKVPAAEIPAVEVSYPEQKGFIVVKINKGTQDYYVVNTHTDRDALYRDQQIAEIRNWLQTNTIIPAGARVVVAGDWNTDLKDDLRNNDVISSKLGGYEKYLKSDIYNADGSREGVTFWNRGIPIGEDFGTRQIDWVLYSKEPRFSQPTSMTAHAFPVRNVFPDIDDKYCEYVDLSDHIGVTATFDYNPFEDPISALSTSNNFTINGGEWTVEDHLRTVADVDGDGRADIVGFKDDAVFVSLGKSDGTFADPINALSTSNNFTINGGGWTVEKHPRTVADVNGDGRADIVGFGEAEVLVSLGESDGTFEDPINALSTSNSNSNNFTINGGGWTVERHPRTVADVNGDGRADIVGFGDDVVYVSLGKSDGTFENPKIAYSNGFTHNKDGWKVERHPRTVADVNGDGRADIVGFGEAEVLVSLGKSDGTFEDYKVAYRNNFTISRGGWTVDNTPRMVADVNGDGRADIVGFGEAAVFLSLGKSDGTFEDPINALSTSNSNSNSNNFTINGGGWTVENHPRTVADVNGDDRADIVGFGDDVVYVSLSKMDPE